jgi:hypothetical protein
MKNPIFNICVGLCDVSNMSRTYYPELLNTKPTHKCMNSGENHNDEEITLKKADLDSTAWRKPGVEITVEDHNGTNFRKTKCDKCETTIAQMASSTTKHTCMCTVCSTLLCFGCYDNMCYNIYMEGWRNNALTMKSQRKKRSLIEACEAIKERHSKRHKTILFKKISVRESETTVVAVVTCFYKKKIS